MAERRGESRSQSGVDACRNNEAFNRNPASKTWMIFIDRLSRRVSRGALWELCGHYGKVKKVFISAINKKPKYKDDTFAFVHFYNRKDMLNVINVLDGTKIDDRTVYASEARFPANMSTQNAAQRGKVYQRKDGKGEGTETNNKNTTRTFRNNPRDSRSYKEVLSEKPVTVDVPVTTRWGVESDSTNRSSEDGVTEFSIPEEEVQWLKRSVAGIMKPSFEREFIQRALLSDGINVKVAKWGSLQNSCIIIFNSTEALESVWSTKFEELSFWFEFLDREVTVDGIPLTFCPISLLGVPIHCWNSDFFTKLANRWGRLIKIHESTSSKDDLSMARMIIRVGSQFDIPDFVKIRINGRLFRIGIKKDETFPKLPEVEFHSESDLGDRNGPEVMVDCDMAFPEAPPENIRDGGSPVNSLPTFYWE
ncbi:hypothetical protein HRI_002752200 [Hibiscus trionum]|uniref:RRM domain-containing protein n=1 Tax=Hibiscus trionum TaxID=183268 RepID=A0A9W7M7W2_HIBTR|nr:hypothetical protein HRI_002752200 [Hibiscus trionum]